MKASLYEYDEKKTQEILKRQYLSEGEKQGFDRGEKQGREEGGREKEESIIRNMLRKGGLTLETIADFVGAPVSQVEALANGMNLA